MFGCLGALIVMDENRPSGSWYVDVTAVVQMPTAMITVPPGL